MKEFLITYRSVTAAQLGRQTLRKHGIDCKLERTPQALRSGGCGYSLRIRAEDVHAARSLLRGYERVFAIPADGMRWQT